MMQEEKNDQLKYLNRYLNMKDWNAIDYYVYFMHDVKKIILIKQKTFHNKQFSKSEMN